MDILVISMCSFLLGFWMRHVKNKKVEKKSETKLPTYKIVSMDINGKTVYAPKYYYKNKYMFLIKLTICDGIYKHAKMHDFYGPLSNPTMNNIDVYDDPKQCEEVINKHRMHFGKIDNFEKDCTVIYN